MAMTVLVTGAAGFIGRALCAYLLDRGETVLGIDNFTSYYDPALKHARIATLAGRPGFEMVTGDIAEEGTVAALMARSGARRVVHLAAQAGVRYSLENPFAYQRSNVEGHLRVLEACRHQPDIEHLVYASSSSVYGQRPAGTAFSEDDSVDNPVSLYAATKRSCELISTSYAHLYGFPQTGLRFFTVYGPWGRPDMAYFLFSEKILKGEPIEVFGEGQMARDFTYIDDIVDGIVGALDRPPPPGTNRILNAGDNRPMGLLDMIAILEQELGRPALRNIRPMQPGDVRSTYADIGKLAALTGYAPKVNLEDGLKRFVAWRLDNHGLVSSLR